MPVDPLLRDRLSSFFQQQQHSPVVLRDDLSAPGPFLAIQNEFPSFHWTAAEGTMQPRVLGIRKLVDQSPFRLSDLRARGFRTESIRHPIRPPVKGMVEHYLMGELQSAAEVKIFLCMHVPPQAWYVLDEHRIIWVP